MRGILLRGQTMFTQKVAMKLQHRVSGNTGKYGDETRKRVPTPSRGISTSSEDQKLCMQGKRCPKASSFLCIHAQASKERYPYVRLGVTTCQTPPTPSPVVW